MTEPNDAGQELSILPALVSYRDTAPHSFVPPSVGSVMAAARRRTQRRVSTLAAVAVLGVVGATAATAAVLPRGDGPSVVGASPSPSGAEPAPSASPSAEPSVPPSETPAVPTSSIPAEAMLTAADLGPGHTENEEVMGDWRLEFFTSICDKFRWTPFPGGERESTDGREREIAGPAGVTQAVTTYVPGAAAYSMTRIRNFVRDCASFTYSGTQYRLAVVASGFAGQDSVMVGEGGGTDLWVYVRQGDLVTQVKYQAGYPQAQARAVAVIAAQRMCAATPAC